LASYFEELNREIQRLGDVDLAEQMKAYIKNQADFHGVKSPARKETLKSYWTRNGIPSEPDMEREITDAWDMRHRELKYCAMEVLNRGHKEWTSQSWQLFEHMATTASWWDTVDYIAATLVHKWSMKFPNGYEKVTERWSKSEDMWLNRMAIIFQLKCKDKTRTDLLERYIVPHIGSGEFFHQKAIGWALRNHSRVDAKWVIDFTERHHLKPLSKREALRLIKTTD